MSLAETITKLCRDWSEARPAMHQGTTTEMTFACSMTPEGAAEYEIAQVRARLSDVDVPGDLATLWSQIRSARLFVDVEWGQWGLELLGPSEAIRETEEMRRDWSSDTMRGDLVVGRFLGDLDRLVVRCDRGSPDYGKILVALPLDHRNDWYAVTDSLASFVDIYAKSEGDKFWE
jgi:hypothetical protein